LARVDPAVISRIINTLKDILNITLSPLLKPY